MKQFVFALLLSTLIIRLSFAQTEIIANDYYDIEFCDSNKSKDVREEFDASNHEKGIPYKICDVRIVSYTSNSLLKDKRYMLRAAYFSCPMATLEEDFVIRSSSIRKAETWWTFYQLEELHLKRSELRELKKILKLCELRMKNNRIIYPEETH